MGTAAHVGLVQNENLFLLHEPDLEVMLVKSSAFDDVLRELGSQDKLAEIHDDITRQATRDCPTNRSP